jgi:hypothetical protein
MWAPQRRKILGNNCRSLYSDGSSSRGKNETKMIYSRKREAFYTLRTMVKKRCAAQ